MRKNDFILLGLCILGLACLILWYLSKKAQQKGTSLGEELKEVVYGSAIGEEVKRVAEGYLTEGYEVRTIEEGTILSRIRARHTEERVYQAPTYTYQSASTVYGIPLLSLLRGTVQPSMAKPRVTTPSSLESVRAYYGVSLPGAIPKPRVITPSSLQTIQEHYGVTLPSIAPSKPRVTRPTSLEMMQKYYGVRV